MLTVMAVVSDFILCLPRIFDTSEAFAQQCGRFHGPRMPIENANIGAISSQAVWVWHPRKTPGNATRSGHLELHDYEPSIAIVTIISFGDTQGLLGRV